MISKKRGLLVLIAFFIFLSVCKAQSKDQNYNWSKFTSEKGKFEVVFPSTPVESVEEKSAIIGKIKSYSYGVSFTKPEVYFVVLYADLPTSRAMNQDDLRTHYDVVQSGLIELQEATLLGYKDVWVNNNLGREITFKAGNEFVKYRTYLVGNRVYQVMVTSAASLMNDKEVEKNTTKFLDSFKLIEEEVDSKNQANIRFNNFLKFSPKVLK